ncbi:NUDIX hydrolase [Cellulosimicrobium funkei]|uniref:NUDIX hydrolase n=1 Tax=Cellulosimicrobium funkei TaxID=264251 RepID=UPI0036956423
MTAPAAPAPDVPPGAALLPVTVDVVALTVRDDALHVLLVERGVEPYRGALALPGGFVLPGERLARAARRELAEETGVRPPGHLEQLRTYGPLDRDPRGPVLSVAYLLLAPEFGVVHAGSDAGGAAWHAVEPLLGDGPGPGLAFDHARILADGVERARAKLEYSALATAFCPPEFTVADLRRVYEAVWGVRLDPRNFSRKATTTAGFLEDTGRTTSGGTGRPAALYRAARPAPGPQPGAGPDAAAPDTAATDAAGPDAAAPDAAAPDPDDAPASVPAVLDPPLMRPRR